MDGMKTEVLHQLSTGKGNAIPGKLLAQRLGERDTRQIRLTIQELIEDGIPIIGATKPPYGYFIAETPQECTECLKQLRGYGVMLFRHYKYLKRASHKTFAGQLSLRL
jgi:biotin operon repressor